MFKKLKTIEIWKWPFSHSYQMKNPYNVGDADNYLMKRLEKIVYSTLSPKRMRVIFESFKKQTKKTFSN